ncbi:MAG: GNAT family N-acetyltransferase [Myxococcales bacterium]|nr:GNAT family N-acetyltransferase [Myxococcales bacterium]
MSITITRIDPGQNIADFLKAGEVVFASDPAWAPPLKIEIEDRLNPKKNPFFERAQAAYFIARRDGQIVGRCTASIDSEHNRVWNEKTGFFGFFDTLDDDAVGKALLDEAAAWLKARGMTRMMGPFSLYANEDVGLLVEGFDTPPMIAMAHSRSWQDRIATAAGLVKEKDLLAWRYDVGAIPPRALRAYEAINQMPEVKLRSVNPKNMREDLKLIMDIYNDAWDGKWAMVPAMPAEVKKTADDLSLILDPELAFIAEVDGKAQAMCVCLPNLNEILHEKRNSHWLSALVSVGWRMKVANKPPRSARLMLLGIRKELRNVRKYMMLSAAMYVEVAKRGAAKGYQWGELSWTREDDSPINAAITLMGAKVYKRYRVYTRAL